jgi:hypothetical protein
VDPTHGSNPESGFFFSSLNFLFVFFVVSMNCFDKCLLVESAPPAPTSFSSPPPHTIDAFGFPPQMAHPAAAQSQVGRSPFAPQPGLFPFGPEKDVQSHQQNQLVSTHSVGCDMWSTCLFEIFFVVVVY